MTPQKFYDYLEGKLPDDERQELERTLIHDPKLQRQFVAARQVHRSLNRPPDDSVTVARAGARGRMVAAAFALLVMLNVGIGLFFIFRTSKPPPEVERAQEEALRARLETSLQQSAAALLPDASLAAAPVVLTVAPEKEDEVAQKIIAAAAAAGGSGTKALPNEGGVSVLVLIPAAAETEFRKTLSTLGAPAAVTAPRPAASPHESVHLQIFLARPH